MAWLKPTSLGAVVYKRHRWIPFIPEIIAPLPLSQLKSCVFRSPIWDPIRFIILCHSTRHSIILPAEVTLLFPFLLNNRQNLFWCFEVSVSWQVGNTEYQTVLHVVLDLSYLPSASLIGKKKSTARTACF